MKIGKSLRVVAEYLEHRLEEGAWILEHPEVLDDESLRVCNACGERISGDVDFFILMRFHCRRCQHRTHMSCSEQPKTTKLCRGCSDPLNWYRPPEHVEKGQDAWPLISAVEEGTRRAIGARLDAKYDPVWRTKPILPEDWENRSVFREARKKLQKRDGSDVLEFTYPGQLYDIMVLDWDELGKPWLGGEKGSWAGTFSSFAQLRNVAAHSRAIEEQGIEGELGLLAEGKAACLRILGRLEQLNNGRLETS